MVGLRYTLGGLVGLVGVSAVLCAAMLDASDLVTVAVFNGTVVLLIASIVGAAATRSERRVFWATFALVALAYLLVVLTEPTHQGRIKPPYEYLLTTELLRAVYLQVAPPRPRPPGPGGILMPVGSYKRTGPSLSNFLLIGQCSFAMFFGVCGGWIATQLYKRSSRRLEQEGPQQRSP